MLIDILKAGYFIVYKAENSLFSKCIVDTQVDNGFSPEDSQYTHVESSLGGPYSIYAAPLGIRPINIFTSHKGRYIKVVKAKAIPEENIHHLAIWSATRCNLPYGFTGLIWFKVKKWFKIKNVFSAIGDVCSEAAGFGLWREGVYKYYDLGQLTKEDIWKLEHCQKVMPKVFNEMMPADFLNPKYFEVVWDGEIA